MTLNHIRFSVLTLLAIILFFDCNKELPSEAGPTGSEEEPDTTYFTVEGIRFSNGIVDNINYRSARIRGDFTSIAPNTSPISQYGHVWSPAPNNLPSSTDIGTQKSELGTRNNIGQFTSEITGLEPGKQYYVRAYIVSGGQTVYHSRSVSFSTLKASEPIVQMGEVTEIAENSITINGRLVADGGEVVTEHGFLWSKSLPEPDINNYEGKVAYGETTSGSTFSTKIEELDNTTLYYLRTYATNFFGTSYSDVKPVKTKSPYVVDNGLIAYYTFEDNSNDVIGNYDGTNFNVNFTSVTPSGLGLAGKFTPAQESFISVPLNPIFQTGQGTISVWLKTSSSNQAILHCNIPDSKYGFNLLFLDDNNIYYNGAEGVLHSTIWKRFFDFDISQLILDNEWHNLAITIKPNEHRLYIDGMLKQQITNRNEGLGQVGVNNGMQIGRWGNSHYFNGILDNLRLYNRVILPEDIEAIFNARQ